MEFSIQCPDDGTVEVSLEDISAVVFRGVETVDIVFSCPRCGAEITVTATMPNLLITALDVTEMLEQVVMDEGRMAEIVDVVLVDDEDDVEYVVEPLSEDEERRIEHYCEYFRRQLGRVDTVESFLQEVDAR